MKSPMRFSLLLFAALGALPALAQDQASCKGYFQVLRAGKGLTSGLDTAQKKWWDKHQRKYAGLCLNGAVTFGDKPRYLVIWSNSNTSGQRPPDPADVYGQKAPALMLTAPTAASTKIYQKRWDLASVTIINVEGDASMLLPPIYFEADDRWTGALTGAGPLNSLHPGSAKVLKAAVDYLYRERIFLPKPD